MFGDSRVHLDATTFTPLYLYAAPLDVGFRACADRYTIYLLERRAQDAQSSGELPSFPMKEYARARHPTLPH